MEGNRQEMAQELMTLVKKNTLVTVVTQELLGGMSDGDLHALLMVIRAHRGVEDCLLQDALAHSGQTVEPELSVEESFAMRSWGG